DAHAGRRGGNRRADRAWRLVPLAQLDHQVAVRPALASEGADGVGLGPAGVGAQPGAYHGPGRLAPLVDDRAVVSHRSGGDELTGTHRDDADLIGHRGHLTWRSGSG